jgi:2,3-bisphosphoglycerate-independent phosphoglycerate mutase
VERVAWVMLDGVGLAPAGERNPLTSAGGTLSRLGMAAKPSENAPGQVLRAIDATLGVAGLPQSGTGQATLLSGVNAARLLGYHHGPWPGPSLRPLLASSLPTRVAAAGGSVRLANAYPQRYRDALATGRMRLNAIATAALAAGAVLEEEGVSPTLGVDESAAGAYGRRLAGDTASLTIFDAWYSDWLGHRGSWEEATAYAARLDAFLEGLLEARPAGTLLVVTSDHGNFEEMAVKTHTLHPVPLVAVGPGAEHFDSVSDLAGVAGPIAALLGLPEAPQTALWGSVA